MPDSSHLREIPSVSELISEVCQNGWGSEFPQDQITEAIREELSILRQRLRLEAAQVPSSEELAGAVRRRLEGYHRYSIKRVINASGIIVHTNLGRAPLAIEALTRIAEIAGSYSNLEFDLIKGRRGSRDEHLDDLLRRVLNAEASLVVNNNAAALLLLLNTLAEGKEVVVSRGELIEIGGSFRLPEIMKKSGAILREVGTTNKTHLRDYREAINSNTALILVVHPSNYRIVGFTEKPELEQLVNLGREVGIPLIEDQGSGILIDLEQYGIVEEPTVQSSLNRGVDVVCFSGDKILGGPQAGILCGRKKLIDRLRRNSLFRALRVDKLTYTALEATILLYFKRRTSQIPILQMLSQSESELKTRALAWLDFLKSAVPSGEWSLQATTCYIGGGVAPMKGIPSWAVGLRAPSADSIAKRLRESDPPVVVRIEDERLFFELRTLTPSDQETINAHLVSILQQQD